MLALRENRIEQQEYLMTAVFLLSFASQASQKLLIYPIRRWCTRRAAKIEQSFIARLRRRHRRLRFRLRQSSKSMAAGLIMVAHKSGGPLLDIVETSAGSQNGFLATDAVEYAENILNIIVNNSEMNGIRNAAR